MTTAASASLMSFARGSGRGGAVHLDPVTLAQAIDGEPRLAVQFAPGHVPPNWPDGTSQQIHLDLFVDDVRAAHDEVISLGARLLKTTDDIESTEGYQVYADPAGHPFCLCWG